jgi:hypothetical protein
VLASLGLFMTELDNMVVTIALPAPWVLAPAARRLDRGET